jgi:leucyl-tRNA synthetase
MVHVNGEVMSKSKGNTVAPDEVIAELGADTLRLYILFENAPEKPVEWDKERISGAHRFLQRLFRFVERETGRGAGDAPTDAAAVAALRRKTHQTIQKVTDDVERLHLNTAVSAMMELLNELHRLEEALSASAAGRKALREGVDSLLILLDPFTPHLCEELWSRLGHAGELVDHPWPAADPEAARAEEVELGVQVNGRVRARITVPVGASEELVRERALAEPRVQEQLAGRVPSKLVVVPGRLVSLVVR